MKSPSELPAGESTSGTAGKTRLHSVFALAADGTLYELPEEVAERFRVTAERKRELGHLPIKPTVSETELLEVEGRSRMWLRSAAYPYHSDWQHGPYIWHADGKTYVGPHRHLDVDSPLAHDLDDEPA